MASHLLWFRLPKGRVWHVSCSGAPVALCGQSIPARGERQPKRPPFGARPCPDCDAVALESQVALVAAGISHRGLTPRAARPLTDPEDDGDLPDLLGQDGEVSLRG